MPFLRFEGVAHGNPTKLSMCPKCLSTCSSAPRNKLSNGVSCFSSFELDQVNNNMLAESSSRDGDIPTSR